jgi:hypothetical protein
VKFAVDDLPNHVVRQCEQILVGRGSMKRLRHPDTIAEFDARDASRKNPMPILRRMRVAKKLSATALSQQSPVLLMLCTMPSRSR